MRRLVTILLLLLSNAPYAQNLVPDSSFEVLTTCPLSFGQVMSPYGPPPSWPQTFTHWVSAVPNSPDCYSGCTSNLYCTVPDNYFGHHPAHTGISYAGIVAISGLPGSWPAVSYREYIETELTQPMTAGQKYTVAMWVKFIIHPYIIQPGYASVSVDRIGAHLSSSQVLAATAPLNNTYISLQTATPGFISDSSQWVRISAEYTAAGGERFLTIGTFNDGVSPAIQPAYPAVPLPTDAHESYYMVDDVSITIEPCDTTIVTHDTLICTTDAIILGPTAIASSYYWSTGETVQNISVNNSGTYWRVATDACNATIDTFHIQYFNSTTTNTHDTSICATQQSIILQGHLGAGSYLWSTGATTSSISIQAGGIYYCKAIENCSLYVDTFHVDGFITSTTVNDTMLCFPANITLSSISDADQYVWDNGQTTASINITLPGRYTCRAYKDCDLYIHDFTITDKAQFKEITLGNDTSICKGNLITIGHDYTGAISYLWNTGATNCCITPESNGLYSVAIDNGCTVLNDNIYIEAVTCENCIYMPTAFTPNADGKNDELGIISKCPLHSFNLKIFNRFGELVYDSKDVTGKWNGMYKGQRADLGAYFYHIQYTSATDMKEHFMKGDVTLIY